MKAAVKEAAENLFTANFGLIRVTKVRRTGSYKKKKNSKESHTYWLITEKIQKEKRLFNSYTIPKSELLNDPL